MLAARKYHSLEEVRQAVAGRPDSAPAIGLFDRLDWFTALHRHCFAGVPVLILSAQEDDREAWLFLLAPHSRPLKALANWYSFSWAPVFLGKPDEASRRRMLDAIAAMLLDGQSRIELYPIEQADELTAALRRAGWITVQRPMGGRHVLPVRGRSFADYWATRPSRLRTLVRRKGRNAPFDLSIEHQLTDDLWRDYLNVHARSWKEAEPEDGLNLLHDLARRESAAGRLRLGFARLDGQPVATQLWTIDRDVALIHKLAHDQRHDAGSPGTLLSHAMFAHVIDVDRVSLIDYGTGDNGYKTDWMEQRIKLIQLDAFNPRRPSSWLPAARTAISALVG